MVLTRDEILDDITLHWVTNTGTSGAQLYWENNNNNFNAVEQRTAEIRIPVGITVFPGEIYQAPRGWAERAYPNLVYFNEVNEGGHFAASEQPELFATELRAAFGRSPGAREQRVRRGRTSGNSRASMSTGPSRVASGTICRKRLRKPSPRRS